MKKHSLLFTILVSTAFFFSSCKKEGCTDPLATNYNEKAKKDDGSCEFPVIAKPEVDIEFNLKVGNEKLEYNKTYTLANGTKFNLSLTHFYLSKLVLSGHGKENPVAFDSTYFLVKPTLGKQKLGVVNAGHYHYLNFNVGIDEATNNQTEADFTAWPSNHPLSFQIPTMHWSWATGYIFVNIEGKVDTTGNGEMDDSFFFHIGLNNNLRKVELITHFDIADGDIHHLKIDVDVATLFDEIDLKKAPKTKSMGSAENIAIASKAADNFAKAFKVHGH